MNKKIQKILTKKVVVRKLHDHPSDEEKHLYENTGVLVIFIFSLVAFVGTTISSFRYFSTNHVLFVFYPFWALGIIYYLVSLLPNNRSMFKKFDLAKHKNFISTWKPDEYPTIDIFLPVCGESIEILKNTWDGVKNLNHHYSKIAGNKVTIYCLDDADKPEVKQLAEHYGFNYIVRENRGYFKKAGNLSNAFKNSNGEFVVVFDADFRPRADFLDELLPYFYADKTLGIVQSPQFFDVHKGQNWIERGAGAVQEYFYRSIQHNRQKSGGAICVGTSAIYRREALASIGGTTLIEHSEDVHTGFDLMAKGWKLQYIPVVLSKGICPDNLESFFKQQYRWCLGSMSLMVSEKFRKTKMSIVTRLAFMSGFFYYACTGIFTIIAPLVPISLIYLEPSQALFVNYVLIVPALFFVLVVFPLWHKYHYGFETQSIKYAYGVSHLIALYDSFFGNPMKWNATGSAQKVKSNHYFAFKAIILGYSVPLAVLWVGGALYYMVTWNFLNFFPAFILGVSFLCVVGRIALEIFHEKIEYDFVAHA